MHTKLKTILIAIGFAILFLPTSTVGAVGSGGTFKTSVRSGKAGTLFTATSNKSCAAVPSGTESRVLVTFTDSAGKITDIAGAPVGASGGTTVKTAANGSWSTTMLVPYKAVDSQSNAIKYTKDAARGVAKVKAQCGYSGSDSQFTATSNYVARSFVVTGASQSFNMSSRFVKQGGKVRISSKHFCSIATTGGIARVYDTQGEIASKTFSVKYGKLQSFSIDIPADATGGIYSVSVECKVPNDKKSLYYAEQPLLVANNYVSLGDSYSSGEGVPTSSGFISGTDTANNQCHRSNGAYSQLVRSSLGLVGGTFGACSGAVINDFYTDNHANANEPAQLSHINDDTNLVTLTIGGNDMGFGNIMGYCAQRAETDPYCKDVLGAQVDAAVAHLASQDPNDTQTLRSVYSAVREKAKNAHVVVLGYPRLFPKNPPTTCDTGVSTLKFAKTDMKWMNDTADKLDLAIKNAAVAQGFTYLDMNSAFKGHELCTSNSYMNPAILSNIVWSFHPNAQGQKAEANVLKNWIKTLK